MLRGFLFVVVAVIGMLFVPVQPLGAGGPPSAPELPSYDHIVIVIEENKNFEQIIGSSAAPYINSLANEGAVLTRMYGEEHYSEGNYFWLFSGSNQGVGYVDVVPPATMTAENLGHQLLTHQYTFAGYSEGLPEISSTVARTSRYARKHVPWVSFENLPHGRSASDSTNLRYPQDFPRDFTKLPTVSFVIPDLIDDMHDGGIPSSIVAGDQWLRKNIDAYYQWAKDHNSLLVVTFDEDDRATGGGPTDPASGDLRRQNHIPTLLAGAHIRPGAYPEGKGANHVTLLRTIEAIYHLPKAGRQQEFAARAGISDDEILTDVFAGGDAGNH